MLSWFKNIITPNTAPEKDQDLEEFDNKITTIVTSLVKSSADVENNVDLANLQNLDVCNEYVIFLGSEIEKRFKKLDAEMIADAIYLGKRRKNSQKKDINNIYTNINKTD